MSVQAIPVTMATAAATSMAMLAFAKKAIKVKTVNSRHKALLHLCGQSPRCLGNLSRPQPLWFRK